MIQKTGKERNGGGYSRKGRKEGAMENEMGEEGKEGRKQCSGQYLARLNSEQKSTAQPMYNAEWCDLQQRNTDMNIQVSYNTHL